MDGSRLAQAQAPHLRVNRILDVACLALLGWAAGIALAGTTRARGSGDTVQLSQSQPVMVGGIALHTLLVLALLVLAIPLVVQVLVSFGRPGPVPGSRLTMAWPLIAGLAAVTAWRFAGGFLVPVTKGAWFAFSATAGTFDGSAILLAAAAVTGLVLRPPRLTPQVLNVARTAAILSVAGSVLVLVMQLWASFRLGPVQGSRPVPLLTLLTHVAVSAGLAVALLRGLRRSAAWAAPGLCVWGLSISLVSLVPPGLSDVLDDQVPRATEAVVYGLDWATNAVLVGAAVLLTPVVLMFRRSSARRRAEMLSGAVIVLGVLLARLLGTQLFEALVFWVRALGDRTEISFSATGLILPVASVVGAGVLIVAGTRLRREPSQTLLAAGVAAVVLPEIALILMPDEGPVVTYVFLPDISGDVPLFLFAWDSYQLTLTLILPILMLILGARLRRLQMQAE